MEGVIGFQHSNQQAHKLSGMHAAMLSPKTPKHLRQHLARKVKAMSSACPTCGQSMPDDEAAEANNGINDNENMETTASAANIIKRSVGPAGLLSKSPKKVQKSHKASKSARAKVVGKPNPFYGG